MLAHTNGSHPIDEIYVLYVCMCTYIHINGTLFLLRKFHLMIHNQCLSIMEFAYENICKALINLSMKAEEVLSLLSSAEQLDGLLAKAMVE